MSSEKVCTNQVGVIVTLDGSEYQTNCVWRKATPAVMKLFFVFTEAILEVHSAQRDRLVYLVMAVLQYAIGVWMSCAEEQQLFLTSLMYVMAVAYTLGAIYSDRRIQRARELRDAALLELQRETAVEVA